MSAQTWREMAQGWVDDKEILADYRVAFLENRLLDLAQKLDDVQQDRMREIKEHYAFVGVDIASGPSDAVAFDSEAADIQYRESMQDAGRGHLLR